MSLGQVPDADPSTPVGPPVHLIVMGVSGCGKTTVATLLVAALGWPMIDADALHPAANIAKMSRGEPLTDEDRWPWLVAIRDWLSDQAVAGHSTVSTCSALKRSYREILRTASGRVRFVFLAADQAVIAARLARRDGHFMPPSLLASQFADLEPLGPDEDAVTVPIDRPAAEVVADILTALQAEGAALPAP